MNSAHRQWKERALDDMRKQRFGYTPGLDTMLQQSPPIRSLLFLLFVFISCSSSTALLSTTIGTTTGSRGRQFNFHATISLWIISAKNSRNFLEVDDDVTPASESLTTRQFFLSSVSSRFVVSTIAVITGVNVPQLPPAATESNNNFGSSNDGDLILTASRPRAHVLSMTLRSLPVSGCWAATVTVSQTLDSDDGNINDDDFYTYLAVVDTGSPFLTAPTGAFPKTKKIGPTKQTKQSLLMHLSTTKKSESDVSYEQYGSTIGSVQWRMVPYLTLIGTGDVESFRSTTEYSRDKSNIITGHRHDGIIPKTEIEPIVIQDQTDFVLGIPSEEVVAETGGIFLGLMAVDAARPTPLQQLGYDAFAMRFGDNGSNTSSNGKNGRIRKKKETSNSNSPATLILWNGKQSNSRKEKKSTVTASLIDRIDPYSMELFDLTPYGPNLHHYGVLCERFECWWGGNDNFDTFSFDCEMGGGVNSCTSERVSSLPGISLSRPVVVVFDTGLSGCIFSDTLWEEIKSERRRLKQYGNNRRQRQRSSVGSKDDFVDVNDENQSNDRNNDVGLSGSNPEEVPPIGCTVWLPTIGSIQTSSAVKLSSSSNYWRFQSFRLPWWYADSDTAKDWNAATSKIRNNVYPHVVVLGSTFWRNPNVLELAVDTTSKRAKITTVATKGQS